MKKLTYFILAIELAACVGNVNPDVRIDTPNDSDSVETIVMVVDTAVAPDTTLMSLSPQQVDSLVFRLTHHYSENFNFVVKADSLTLLPREGDLLTDTCHVHRNDIIAVAAIKSIPGDSIDSIWVKVASNQLTMGWIPEQELLHGATPNDPISEILNTLTNSRAIWMSAIVALGLLTIMVGRERRQGEPLTQKIRELDLNHLTFNGLKKGLKFKELRSPYPALFLMLVGLMASVYASVQNFVPEFWQEYYFHPTLNPLVLPPVMAMLVVFMWLVIITFIAVVDETYNHLYILPGITYLVELLGLAMLVYLVISWTTLFYIGYVLLAILIWQLGMHLYRITTTTPPDE